MILYVATTNPGKLRDFATAAKDRIDIQPLPGLADIPPPAENSPYFEDNARAKAVRYSCHAPGLLVLADDSGLEVEALDGAPGVRSARYADDLHFPTPPGTTTDERNNLCLLHALADKPQPRRARYRCVLAVTLSVKMSDDEISRLRKRRPNLVGGVARKDTTVSHGIVEGEILTAPRGTGGFGYDPLFYLPEKNLTMAELDPVTRLGLSHRGRALHNLLNILLQQIDAGQFG